MVIAARIAQAMGSAQEGFSEKLAQDLRSCGLPASLEECLATAHLKMGELAQTIKKDKKVVGDNIHFILPLGLENVNDVMIPLEKLKKICNDLR
jgi:3-dehydroquinate synthetase